MADKSAIEWTDTTWNPVVGCSSVSEGCRNCYAAREAIRLAGNPHPNVGPLYTGLSEFRGTGEARRPVFTGIVRTLPERLEQPLRWRKPRRVFVNSVSDLFHEDVDEEFITRVFTVMALSTRHTFQVLTKRPERMADLVARMGEAAAINDYAAEYMDWEDMPLVDWPLENVWLGTSCEDQAAADERIPHLLRTPAAVRFLSCEPLLGPVDLMRLRPVGLTWLDALHGRAHDHPSVFQTKRIHWVVAGGESGPGARPCDVAWIRSLIEQCQAAGVPCFVKQLGAVVHDRNDAGFDAYMEVDTETGEPTFPTAWPEPLEVEHDVHGFREEYQGATVHVHLRDRKGGDPEEWPVDLRVRKFPRQA